MRIYALSWSQFSRLSIDCFDHDYLNFFLAVPSFRNVSRLTVFKQVAILSAIPKIPIHPKNMFWDLEQVSTGNRKARFWRVWLFVLNSQGGIIFFVVFFHTTFSPFFIVTLFPSVIELTFDCFQFFTITKIFHVFFT